jgi:hypothetical protein
MLLSQVLLGLQYVLPAGQIKQRKANNMLLLSYYLMLRLHQLNYK